MPEYTKAYIRPSRISNFYRGRTTGSPAFRGREKGRSLNSTAWTRHICRVSGSAYWTG